LCFTGNRPPRGDKQGFDAFCFLDAFDEDYSIQGNTGRELSEEEEGVGKLINFYSMTKGPRNKRGPFVKRFF
jgi:hypothetical protein